MPIERNAWFGSKIYDSKNNDKNLLFMMHSMLSGFWIKLKILSMGPLWDERAYIWGSEYILFQILD